MDDHYNLQRFLDAQQSGYATALAEIKNGRKHSHWMWYIFPQIRGLGFTETSKYYAIKDIHEASDYLSHPLLGARLNEISNELLKLPDNNPAQVFGSPDDMKLKSCMTLFSSVPGAGNAFQHVLDKYFEGAKDIRTLQLIESA
jgi:uncharacterized protein (DUF1810 family)